MKHIFRQGSDQNQPVLLLLHGTGGDENDLLPLAEHLSPTTSVLSVRGNVLENGMPRFFRRLAVGVFDEEDLIFRTKELNEFVEEAAEKYPFNRKNVVAVGYSNGANIAASLLYHFENSLAGAILYHPMVPLRGIKLPKQEGVPVLITAGKTDPICPAAETEELAAVLRNAGADVTVHWEPGGHQLTRAEVEISRKWFQERFGG